MQIIILQIDYPHLTVSSRWLNDVLVVLPIVRNAPVVTDFSLAALFHPDTFFDLLLK